MVANPNSTMLLGIFSLELRNKYKKTWAIFSSFLFSSFFLGGHQSTYYFDISDNCPFFILSFA
jgi:hypothetical protein